jgi:type VI protein secretion system component VasF
MFWDDLVRRWKRDVGGLSPRLLRATAGHVAVLPARRARRRSRMPWLLLIALVLAVAVLLLQSGEAHGMAAAIAP